MKCPDSLETPVRFVCGAVSIHTTRPNKFGRRREALGWCLAFFAVFAAAERASQASDGRDGVSLVFADRSVRSGGSLTVEIQGAAPGQSTALLVSGSPGPTNLPPLGELCIGRFRRARNLLGTAVANFRGLAEFEIELPYRAFPEGLSAYFQGVAVLPESATGFGVTNGVRLPWTQDSLWMVEVSGTRLVQYRREDGIRSELDLATGEVRRLVHDPSTHRVYVILAGSPPRLASVNSRSMSSEAILELPMDFYPTTFVLVKGADRLFVLDGTRGELLSISTDGLQIDRRVSLPFDQIPYSGVFFAETPVGEAILLPSLLRPYVTVLDPFSMGISGQIDLSGLVLAGSGTNEWGAATRRENGKDEAFLVVQGVSHSSSKVLIPIDLKSFPFQPMAPSDVFAVRGTGGLVVSRGSAYFLDSGSDNLIVFDLDDVRVPGPRRIRDVAVPGAETGLVLTDSRSLVVRTSSGFSQLNLDEPTSPRMETPILVQGVGRIADLKP